jgi:tetratricopeptide (TPR) repeat protein
LSRRVAIVLLLVAVVAAYADSFDGAFVFDDFPAIVENPHVRSLLPLSQSLSTTAEAPTAGRPVAAFTFAVSYALARLREDASAGQGPDTWWFHATNVAIHACAALVLFGAIRRTLLTPPLGPRFGASSTAMAFLIALLWAVHPLQTQSVTYIVQRIESLMGLFLLLTVYCAIRAGESFRLKAEATGTKRKTGEFFRLKAEATGTKSKSRGFRLQAEGSWIAISVVCCALGMATKQTMVGAPVLVILWDWLFASRMRWKFHAALAATWALLAWLAITEPRPHSVGSIEGWTPISYLATQGGVILHYLRLSLVPAPLVFDYDWPPARGLAAIAIPVVIVGGLLAWTCAGVARRRPWAFAGAWFFIILAPTSSVLPIVTEVAAEHRMYLPVAAVLAVVVLGAQALGARLRQPRLLALVGGSLLVFFAIQTISRNRVYESDERIWVDTITRRPSNARAHNNYAVDLLKTGRLEEAETQARWAVSLNPARAASQQTLGVVLLAKGRADEGIDALEEARSLDPTDAKTHQNLGEAYGAKGDLAAAVLAFLDAVQNQPDDPFVLNRAGWILATAPEPRIRDGARALALASHAVEVTRRQDVVSLDTLAAAHAELGQFDAAIPAAREALSLAQAKGDGGMLPELRQRLETYLARRPFRTP